MSVRRAALLAGAAALLGACDAPTVPVAAPAWDPGLPLVEGGTGTYHWRLGSVIRLYVDSAAQPPGTDLRAAVQHGADLWEGAIDYREFDLRIVPQLEDADVVVQFTAAPALVTLPQSCEGAIGGEGVTVLCTAPGTDSIVPIPFSSGAPGSHVRMAVFIRTDIATDSAHFRSVVTHELGHVIGIGTHSPARTDLMTSVPTVAAPSAADIRTLDYVLHRSSDFIL